jgi:Uma2 family endonuclease
MTVDQFIAWARGAPAGRYELVDGEIIEMPAEGGRQNAVKLECAIALREAVAKAGLACHVFTDGMTVRIDEHRGREPDAAVTAGPMTDPGSTDMVDPLILVEVTSPDSVKRDTVDKLIDYFSVPSVIHYLIVNPDAKVIVHHRRIDGGEILTRIVRSGPITLDPPGIGIAADRVLAAGG